MAAPHGSGSTGCDYTPVMAPHTHRWDADYEFHGTTYRECADPECRGHQQWICALDRWSDAFETPSPREREALRKADDEVPASR